MQVKLRLLVFVVFLACAVCLASPFQKSMTLRVPHDPVTGSYDERRACLSFKASLAETPDSDCDLQYGFLAINNEDWFGVSTGKEKRSVIIDLGKLDWSDSFKVPVLQPLPELFSGEQRSITVDASADTHKQWAKTNRIFAKAFEGHMYAVHIKDSSWDFYALFRVESLTQRNNCVITWALIESPESTVKIK